MQDIIHLLPDSIANQIAAGEVVQRPASAVKELLENAIDAGATQIQLIVKEAGKTLIQVIDNGSGMSPTDARMCFERHATSKIRKSEDLFALTTMGFRGEAMASIAAIAQVELRTKRDLDETGFLLKIEGSVTKTTEALVCPVGSNIMVKNLFFNVPARRNFLKSNPVEMKHILDEFQRVALANYTVGFQFFNGEEEVFNLPAGKLAKRIVDIFGKNYQQQLAPCLEETDFLKITGYIGKPDYAKKTRNEQFFFANGRFIKSSYLHHAVMTAFAGMLEEGSYPFYCLFLEIDPARIDINVHPTKTEIKFEDERSVYAVVSAACRRAMNQFNLNPNIDFDADVPADFLGPGAFTPKTYNPASISYNTPLPKTENEKANLNNWQTLYKGIENINAFERKPSHVSQGFVQHENTTGQEQIVFQSKMNPVPNTPIIETQNSYQIHQKYIISQVKSGFMLIDQKAALERIIFDSYQNLNTEGKTAASQTLMFPDTVTLNPADYVLLSEMEAYFTQMGFGIGLVGGNSLIVNSLPTDLASEPAQGLIESLLEQFKLQAELKIDKKEKLTLSIAKKSAAHRSKTMNNAEQLGLIEQLFSSTNPQYSPSGQVIMKIIGVEKLQELLG